MSQPQQFISYQKGMEHTRQNVDMPTYVPPSPVAPAAAVPDTMDERMSLLDRYNDLKAKAASRGMDLNFDQAAQLLQVNPQELGQVAQNAGVPTQPAVPVAQPTMAEQQGTGAPAPQPSMADAQGTGAVPTQPSMADAQAPVKRYVVDPAPSMADAQGTGLVPVSRPNMAQAQQPSMAQAQAGATQALSPSMAQQQAPTQQSAQRAKAVNPYASGTSTPSMAQAQAPSQQQAQSARRATQQQAQRNRRGRQVNRGYGQGRR